MIKKTSRNELRIEKHKRIRRKLSGTGEVPRLCVYKSLKHIYAQIIDDQKGVTLVAASTHDGNFKNLNSTTDTEAAKKVGGLIAEKAVSQGIKAVVFDRGGYKYHGNVAAFADAAREGGLQF
ncbi:MAG: 50S ribosomal protein L18 [Syntrophomonadaceae bacterium]|nr:50S ribosomal protein L18 [Syntrophomonadaceae bacterium]